MSKFAETLLSAKGVSKSYSRGGRVLDILKAVSLEVKKGEALCIVGSSGAGKSTLLHILGTLDQPSLGKVFFKNKELTRLGNADLARFRNQSLGFVFQFHHLLAEFTALENVVMPARIGGKSLGKSMQRAKDLLVQMGLEDRMNHYPDMLSGGEQQRVAIARALIQNPDVLLADEPTGNLDSQNAAKIQDLFFELKRELGLTLIVVTHDLQFAQRFPRRLELKDGHWA